MLQNIIISVASFLIHSRLICRLGYLLPDGLFCAAGRYYILFIISAYLMKVTFSSCFSSIFFIYITKADSHFMIDSIYKQVPVLHRKSFSSSSLRFVYSFKICNYEFQIQLTATVYSLIKFFNNVFSNSS